MKDHKTLIRATLKLNIINKKTLLHYLLNASSQNTGVNEGGDELYTEVQLMFIALRGHLLQLVDDTHFVSD